MDNLMEIGNLTTSYDLVVSIKSEINELKKELDNIVKVYIPIERDYRYMYLSEVLTSIKICKELIRKWG